MAGDDPGVRSKPDEDEDSCRREILLLRASHVAQLESVDESLVIGFDAVDNGVPDDFDFRILEQPLLEDLGRSQ